MMPRMDGWSVLAALKSDPELAEIPVIMVTIVDDKNLGYSLGASDYLTKPIHRKRLAAVLAPLSVPPAAPWWSTTIGTAGAWSARSSRRTAGR